MKERDNVLRDKSYIFALRIVQTCQVVNNLKKEFILSNQILRSGTAIGALIRESEFAQSKQDFISKLSIALKEANETEYWLSLLKDSLIITESDYISLSSLCNELMRLLISSITTAKKNMTK